MRATSQIQSGYAILRAIFLCSLLSLGALSANAHQGATGIIKERMDKFSEARQQMRQMRQTLTDLKAIAQTSQDMLSWAQDMKEAFPEGSDAAPSEAAPAIWTDRAGFNLKIDAYYEAILSLNQAALSGNQEATLAAYKAVGASCQSCHQSYRR